MRRARHCSAHAGQRGLQQALPNAFNVMFATVFVMNIGHVINTLMYFKKKEAAGGAKP